MVCVDEEIIIISFTNLFYFKIANIFGKYKKLKKIYVSDRDLRNYIHNEYLKKYYGYECSHCNEIFLYHQLDYTFCKKSKNTWYIKINDTSII